MIRKINGTIANVLNLFFLLFCIVFSLSVLGQLDYFLGVGIYWSFAFGFLLGGLIYCLFIFVVGEIFEFFLPVRPPCLCGRRLKLIFSNGVYRVAGCKCKRVYLGRNDFFAEVLFNGDLKPYMMKNSRGRWVLWASDVVNADFDYRQLEYIVCWVNKAR